MADDRLISLNAAIDAFKKELTVGESKGNYVTICSAIGYEGAKHILESLPFVDAVPVRHGHWIYHPDWQADGECGYECSECGMGSDVDYQFCMRCGADMRKDGEQHD